MLPASCVVPWLARLAFTVPLALLFLMSLPSGAPLQIAMHAILLVLGGAIVVALGSETDPD